LTHPPITAPAGRSTQSIFTAGTPGRRASLADAVMDLPEVQASTRMEATVPLGDGESLERLRERTEDAITRSACSTTLLDANIPSSDQPGPRQDPDDRLNRPFKSWRPWHAGGGMSARIQHRFPPPLLPVFR
ncbi:MAG TPA: hypothetical protein VGD83_10810, partial [Streptosporangiaceae bacterium]